MPTSNFVSVAIAREGSNMGIFSKRVMLKICKIV
jgi:hypothetical protein